MAASRTDTSSGFSLIEGGLLFRLQRAAHLLSGRHNALRRALVLAVVGWLPVALSAAIGGVEPGKLIPLHLRFLIAIPILLWAEGYVDRRVRKAVGAFVDTGIVAGDGATRFRTIVGEVQRLRESGGALVLTVVLAFGLSVVAGATGLAQRVAVSVPFADAWFAYVSLPLFRIVLLLWIWRWVAWAILLARVSRLDLRLVPTHPDMAGGIGFLEQAALSFLSVLVAAGAVIAGGMVLSLTSTRAALSSLAQPVIGFGIIAGVMVVGPLLFFAHKLVVAKRRGQLDYGALATRHNREFGERWIGDRGVVGGADPVGEPGISSLADIGTSYGYVDRIRALPFGKRSMMMVIAVSALPVIPSLVARIPIDQMIKQVIKAAL